jgi:hypothetical protein
VLLEVSFLSESKLNSLTLLLLHESNLLVKLINLFSIGQFNLSQLTFNLDLAFLTVLFQVSIESVIKIGKAPHLSTEAIWSGFYFTLKLFEFGGQLSFLGKKFGCL